MTLLEGIFLVLIAPFLWGLGAILACAVAILAIVGVVKFLDRLDRK